MINLQQAHCRNFNEGWCGGLQAEWEYAPTYTEFALALKFQIVANHQCLRIRNTILAAIYNPKCGGVSDKLHMLQTPLAE